MLTFFNRTSMASFSTKRSITSASFCSIFATQSISATPYTFALFLLHWNQQSLFTFSNEPHESTLYYCLHKFSFINLFIAFLRNEWKIYFLRWSNDCIEACMEHIQYPQMHYKKIFQKL